MWEEKKKDNQTETSRETPFSIKLQAAERVTWKRAHIDVAICPLWFLNECLGMPATLSTQRSLSRQIASRSSADVFPAGYRAV